MVTTFEQQKESVLTSLQALSAANDYLIIKSGKTFVEQEKELNKKRVKIHRVMRYRLRHKDEGILYLPFFKIAGLCDYWQMSFDSLLQIGKEQIEKNK